MTVSNSVQALEETRTVPTVCPICKTKKNVDLPESIVNQASNIATISLPKGLVCDHHFQMFVDKNFHVRGYQKVDLEIEIHGKDEKKNDKDLFDNLLLEGNYLKYQPKIIQENKKPAIVKQKITDRSKKMSNEEIYDEFWEFIEDDNAEFQEFIVKDRRRKKQIHR